MTAAADGLCHPVVIRGFDPSPTWRNHRLFTLMSSYPSPWALTAGNYVRHRLTGSATPARDVVTARLTGRLGHARGRARGD